MPSAIATGGPVCAESTSQVPSVRKSPVTGVPPDNERAQGQTCPETPLDATLPHRSWNPLVPALGSFVLGVSGLVISDSEESTVRLDDTKWHGENVTSGDECSSVVEGSAGGLHLQTGARTATGEEPPPKRSDICVASEDSAPDCTSWHGVVGASSDEV